MSQPAPALDRVPLYRSIRARLVLATSALIVAIIASSVTAWVTSEQAQLDRVTRTDARSVVAALAAAWGNELSDQNWTQISVQVGHLLAVGDDFAYLVVTDARQGGRIVAAWPPDLIGEYVPDLVPYSVSVAADGTEPVREAETFLLRDVEFPEGTVRASRGGRILEVATDALLGSERVGVLRLGVSLERLDRVRDDVLWRGLTLGALFLVLGILGAWFIGHRLTSSITRLTESTRRMSGGDLAHRVPRLGADEVGLLARTFNQMAGSLEQSFSTLNATVTSFERFVPQKFLHVVAPEGIERIRLGTYAVRPVTILFSDIRGYTQLSEKSEDEEMFHLLNEYLPEMGEAIDQNGGFVDKYIGDAIMALFDDANSDGALLAALEMRRRLAALNARWEAAGREQIEIGVGIHRGAVVMGTVGYSSRIDSTVIGDAVNLASRIEGLTKQYKCEILVSGAVIQTLASPGRFALAIVDGSAPVRGKTESIALYRLDDIDTPRLSRLPG